MAGRDTAAAFKGLILGAVFVAIVVVTVTMLTNKKFESHEGTPAATESH
jgi:hypothetical protein